MQASDGSPLQRAMVAVDPADQFVQFLSKPLVRRDATPRGHGHLNQSDPPAHVRVVAQQALVGKQAPKNALRVIETIDAEQYVLMR